MGSGFKDWAAGDVLTAADVDGYLMRQTVMTFADSSARDTALSGVLDEGMVAYLEDADVFTVYDGSSWFQYGPGKILQIVSTTKTDTFSASLAGYASTAVTGLTATITPSSTASKILVISAVLGANSGGPSGISAYSLTRDATLIAQPASPGSRLPLTTLNVGQSGPFNQQGGTAVYLDSPASTSSLVYGVSIFNILGTTETVYVNRGDNDTDANSRRRTVSSITVMEVSA